MTWILDNLSLIGSRTLSHLALSAPPIVLTLLISVPLAWLANRLGRARGVFIAFFSILYAIPSLALFLLLPLIIGGSIRSNTNVIIVLTIYGIALMTSLTADAFRSVSADVLLSATAVGYGPWRQFFAVELPLSGPVILAALRVISVSTVSLVTVAGALGTPNLGLLFLDGFQRGIAAEIVAGIVMVVVIALVFDLMLVLLGGVLMPWRRASSPRAARSRRAATSGQDSATAEDWRRGEEVLR